MAKFIFGQYGMRVQNKGKTLAYFDFISVDLGLEFKDWKLMQGESGTFVSSPSEFWENAKTGKSGWKNFVMVSLDKDKQKNPKGQAFMDALTEAALAEYQRKNGGEGPVASAPAKKSGAGVFERKSASPRGGLDYDAMFPGKGGSDDDDGLPF